MLSQSFQGPAAVRPLAAADHQALEKLASGLPKLDRVSFYPEDAFEAWLIHGDAAREMVVPDMVAAQNRIAEPVQDDLVHLTPDALCRSCAQATPAGAATAIAQHLG